MQTIRVTIRIASCLWALALSAGAAWAQPDPLLPTSEARRAEQLQTLARGPALDASELVGPVAARADVAVASWIAALGTVLAGGGGLFLLRRRRASSPIPARRTELRVQAPLFSPTLAPARVLRTPPTPPIPSASAAEPAPVVAPPPADELLARIAGLESSLLQIVESVEQLAARLEAQRVERPRPRVRRERPANDRPSVVASARTEGSVPRSISGYDGPVVPRFEERPWSDPEIALPPAPAAQAPVALTPIQSAPAEMSPASLRDPRRAREVVLGLVRQGYDRARIQAQTRLPESDLTLILTSLRGAQADRAAETARSGR